MDASAALMHQQPLMNMPGQTWGGKTGPDGHGLGDNSNGLVGAPTSPLHEQVKAEPHDQL